MVDTPIPQWITDLDDEKPYADVVDGIRVPPVSPYDGHGQLAIRIGSRLSVLDFDERIGGYASYGRNRVPALPFRGEIFELYLAPEYQGMGFGRRLFQAARKDLAEHGYETCLVWALADNERATSFYLRLGGRIVPRAAARFGQAMPGRHEMRGRIAFGFD